MQHITMEPYALHPLSFSHAMPGEAPASYVLRSRIQICICVARFQLDSEVRTG